MIVAGYELELEEAIDRWLIAQRTGGCSCIHHPPCNFCVDGFSLCLDEYLEHFDDPQIVGQI